LIPHGGCDDGPLPVPVQRTNSGSGPTARAPPNMDHSETSVLPAGLENWSDKDLQRADGGCRIVLGGSEKGTRIMDLYQKSPTRVLFPSTPGDRVQEGVLLNTSGGVAGGDRLEANVTAKEGASIAITTQAAEKVYRALTESAYILTTLRVRDTAKLAWLPQETIIFNRARIFRETRVDVTSGTELLALEWLVLGRAAHGEKLVAGTVTDRWRVLKDGRLIWADSFRITDEVLPHLSCKALLADCASVATLIYFGAELVTRLELLRDLGPSVECHCAATLVGGLVVARFAARTSYDLKTALRNVLQEFGSGLDKGPFRIPRMWSC
jgi:urease accessory protein